jgi:hypothetical protein
MGLEVARAAHHDGPDVADLARAQRGVRQLADSDRDVDPFVGERHHPIEQLQAHRHPRVGREELLDERQHVELAKQDRSRDGQRPA